MCHRVTLHYTETCVRAARARCRQKIWRAADTDAGNTRSEITAMQTANFLLSHTDRPNRAQSTGSNRKHGCFVMGLPSIMSGALPGVLPCFNAPPEQNDLVVKDAADRSNRNLQKQTNKQKHKRWDDNETEESIYTDTHLLILTIRPVFNPAVNSWADRLKPAAPLWHFVTVTDFDSNLL